MTISEKFIAAFEKLISNEYAKNNFECYLDHHFAEWLQKFASTPEDITAELENFAEIRGEEVGA